MGKEAKKPRNRPKKEGGPGRPSLSDGTDPLFEGRLSFIAELQAGFKKRRQILEACRARGWEIGDSQIDQYIAEVRRRWKSENNLPDIMEKKAEAIHRLQAMFQKAEHRVSYTDKGSEYPNPDLWLMRQILLDILKIEGVSEHKESANGELEAILDRLAEERKNSPDSEGGNLCQ